MILFTRIASAVSRTVERVVRNLSWKARDIARRQKCGLRLQRPTKGAAAVLRTLPPLVVPLARVRVPQDLKGE
jgi:hypothetical protein